MFTITIFDMKDFLTTRNGRVFIVVTPKETFFCHLEDIPNIVKAGTEHEKDIYLYHYWNNEKQRTTKHFINKMFEAHKIDFRFRTFK